MSRFLSPGLAALLLLFVVSAIGLPFIALVQTAEQLNVIEVLNNVWIQRVITFSVWQAFLSTLLSIGLAIPVAIALSGEPRFPGRQWLLNAFSLSLVMPTVVAIFGIVTVYGRTGWLSSSLNSVGLESISLYGLNGILLAHVFFNLPLATRIFLVALDGIPTSQWRLSAQLGIHGFARLRHIEWPAIRSHIAGTAVLIFALCLSSFAVVLTLGGGPRATTIEVAIYQALRFDFDLGTAVSLAFIQLFICVLVLTLGSLWKQNLPMAFSSSHHHAHWRPATQWRTANALIIALASGFTLLPVFGLIASALNPALVRVLLSPSTLEALINTVLVGICSASLSCVMGIGLLLIARHCQYRWNWLRTGQWIRQAGNSILVMPPLVLGTGYFLLLRPYADVFSLALWLVIMTNALLGLPFVMKILEAPIHQMASSHDRLIQSLGISGWARLRWIDWPTLKPAGGFAFGIAASLSAGDLSAIALFGSDRVTTLPLLLYQRMGSYRMEEAAVTAVLLLVTCLSLFMLSHWATRSTRGTRGTRQTETVQEHT